MKTVLGALMIASLVAGRAIAADLSVQAPLCKAPPPLPAFNWTGFYIGGTLGGEWARSKYSETPTGAYFTARPVGVAHLIEAGTGTLSPSGVIGGGEAGFNWQTGQFVFGAETDISAWNLSRSAAVTVPPAPPVGSVTATTSTNSNWLFTARTRIGIANNNWLFFATGGLALSHVDSAQSIFFGATNQTQAGAASATQAGWTVGGGVEYALSRNWSFKGEYLYVSLPNQTANQFNPSNPPFTGVAAANLNVSIGRVGVNYRF
jgi:outer membrane immunogenic protein